MNSRQWGKDNESEQIMKLTPYSYLFNYFLIRYCDIMNSLKSDKTH